MAPENASAGQWDTVAAELRAYRDQQKETWGDIDNALLGRYLAGEADEQDRQRVEADLQEHPELRKLTDLVRDVLGDNPPVASTAPTQPRILPFTQKSTPMKWKPGRARLALLLAASVMLALGLFLYNSPKQGDSSSPPLSTAYFAARAKQDKGARTDGSAPAPRRAMVAKSDEGDKKDRIPALQPLQFVVSAKLADPERAKFAADKVSTLELHAVADVVDRLVAQDKQGWSNPYGGPGSYPYYTPSAPGSYFTPFAAAVDVTAAKVDIEAKTKEQTILSNAIPLLEYGVCQQQEPQLQKRCAEVLARMGPAAGPAVKPLANTLLKSESPQQQETIVQFFHQMGPAARDAAPVLEKFAANARNTRAELKQQAQEAYRSVSGPAWVGVRDHARMLDEATRNRINARLSEFSRRNQFPIVAETFAAKAPKSLTGGGGTLKADQEQVKEFARRRSNELGASNGMYVLICQEPPLVQVTFGDQAKLGKEADRAADTVRQGFERGLHVKKNLEKELDVAIRELQETVEKNRK